jgi:AraC-like DNA-binding protein
MSKPRLRTQNTAIVEGNWFQFTPGQRILHPQVLSRMLLWCQAGRGRVRINGAWHDLDIDQFLFLPWGREILYLADAAQPFWVGGIHLIPDHARNHKVTFGASHRTGDLESSWKWRRDLKWAGLEGVRSGAARSTDPLRLLATYIVERRETMRHSESFLRSLAEMLVDEIAEALSERASGAGSEVVRRAQEFVEAHLDRPISVADLARWTDCSASTVRRQFQETLKLPPYEWILNLRIQRAQRLVATTTLRIREVAAQVGFEDAFQFSRIFKQRTGRSPREFRYGQAFHPRKLIRVL